MATYRVYLEHRVSTAVDVEADSIDKARDLAERNAPTPTNASNHGIDPAGEWEALAVYDEHGDEVWNELSGETTS